MTDSLKLGLAAFLLLMPGDSIAGNLSPQESRGKQIYFEGSSPSGESITAVLGADGIRLPGAALTCAGCHGADGRGRPEAGVLPSDITWEHLLKPYGHRHVMGRSHPAFSEESLKETLRTGSDPAGNRLDPSMPIYELSDADLEDLLSYLKRLETDFDPGLSEATIRVGTLLPDRGRLAEIGRGVRIVLSAYFDRVNAQGGLYGRRLELVVADYDGEPAGAADASEKLFTDGDIFTVLSPIAAGAEAQITDLAEQHLMPVIGPLTLLSPDSLTLNDHVFYLYGGLREQVRVLVDYTARELALSNPRFAVIGSATESHRDVLRAIERQRLVHGWDADPPTELPGDTDAQAAARQLAEEQVAALFVLGSADLGGLLAAGEEIGWRPMVLLPGGFASQQIFELPAASQGRIHLAYPTLPSDVTATGAAELQALVAGEQGSGPSPRHHPAQISALAAAKVLVAALRDAGRGLRRDKLLQSLEKLHALETGLSPPVTYDANRRIGTLGAYIVAIDPAVNRFSPIGGWRTPGERQARPASQRATSP